MGSRRRSAREKAWRSDRFSTHPHVKEATAGVISFAIFQGATAHVVTRDELFDSLQRPSRRNVCPLPRLARLRQGARDERPLGRGRAEPDALALVAVVVAPCDDAAQDTRVCARVCGEQHCGHIFRIHGPCQDEFSNMRTNFLI